MSVPAGQTVPLPPSLSYGKVMGRFLLPVVDGPDEDRLPDGKGAVGLVVTLRPVTDLHRKAHDGQGLPGMSTVLRQPVECVVGADGQVRAKGAGDDLPGLWVPTGPYRVTYSGLTAWTRPKDHDIVVTDAHDAETPLDLTVAEDTPIPPGTPVSVLQVSGSPVPGYIVGVTSAGTLAYLSDEQWRGAPGAGVVGGRDLGDGRVVFTLSDGSETDPVAMPPGPAGRGVESIVRDGDSLTATITYTDESTATLDLPPGEDGHTPSIRIGTVTSGTTPSATMKGTSPDLTLDLVLAKGDPGAPGAPGVVSSASSYVIVGPGRPDVPSTTAGVITGAEPVGAEYRSQDGAGVGADVWLKTSRGWVVSLGDTGWRDITALQTGPAPTGGRLIVRRMGALVSAGFEDLKWATGPGSTRATLNLPAGFAANAKYMGALYGFDGTTWGYNFRTDWPGIWPNSKGEIWLREYRQWNTAQPWPTAPLPGTPA